MKCKNCQNKLLKDTKSCGEILKGNDTFCESCGACIEDEEKKLLGTG